MSAFPKTSANPLLVTIPLPKDYFCETTSEKCASESSGDETMKVVDKNICLTPIWGPDMDFQVDQQENTNAPVTKVGNIFKVEKPVEVKAKNVKYGIPDDHVQVLLGLRTFKYKPISKKRKELASKSQTEKKSSENGRQTATKSRRPKRGWTHKKKSSAAKKPEKKVLAGSLRDVIPKALKPL